MTRTSRKPKQNHEHEHEHEHEHRRRKHAQLPSASPEWHPAERHPLTVGRLHWLLPVTGGVLGLFVGLGLLLAIDARRPIPAMFWLSHARTSSIGMHVRSDLYDMSVLGIRTAKPDPAFTPAQDDDIVAVNVGIKNSGNEAHSFFPSIQTYIRDEEGDTYTMHPSLDLHNPMPAGDIKPGVEVDGELSYELPKRLHKFWLYIDPHWNDMAPVVFYLQR